MSGRYATSWPFSIWPRHSADKACKLKNLLYIYLFNNNRCGSFNMKNVTLVGIFLLVSSFFTGSAIAQCRQAQVCDDYGQNCRVRQICGSSIDLPGINLPPLQPMPSMEIKPLPSMQLPPLGTTRCEYKQVNGRWQNVCQ